MRRLVAAILLIAPTACRAPASQVPPAPVEPAEMPRAARDEQVPPSPVPQSVVPPSALPPSARAPSEELATRPTVLFDGPVEVGVHTSYVHCKGPDAQTPPPLVVLDSGYGDGGAVWDAVLPEVARFVRVCAYDRLGIGRSSPAPLRNSVEQMVGQLRAVLAQVAPREALVLVGHSLGGLTTRLYASEYPAEVAGLVLVDAASDGQDARVWSLLPAEPLKQFQRMLARGPEHLDYEGFRAGMAEVERVTAAAGGLPLGDRPLVVLTAAKQEMIQVSPEADARMTKVWLDLQAELPNLSSNSTHYITQESGHFIHVEQPALVVAAIREVLRASRSGSPVRATFAE
jgi:pimeloyl-ACP methyl ester carboxylesterase